MPVMPVEVPRCDHQNKIDQFIPIVKRTSEEYSLERKISRVAMPVLALIAMFIFTAGTYEINSYASTIVGFILSAFYLRLTQVVDFDAGYREGLLAGAEGLADAIQS